MGWEQDVIDEHFHGDAARFEQACQDLIAEERLYVVPWQALADAATILPDLEQAACELIERRLGWLPHDSVKLAFEPFLRSLIQQHRTGALTDEAFSAQSDAHIKLLRNVEMAHSTALTYSPAFCQTYETYLPHHKQPARDRLVHLLGYAPPLEHTLTAELWLREVLAQDRFQLPAAPTAVDYKALTLVKYREVLLTQGKAAADSSPLWGPISASE